MFHGDAIAHCADGDRRKVDYFKLTDFTFNDVAIQPVIPLRARLVLCRPVPMTKIFFNDPSDGAIDKNDIVPSERTAFGIGQIARIGIMECDRVGLAG